MAGVGGLIAYAAMGTAGAISGIFSDQRQIESLEDQKEAVERQKQRTLELMDLNFDIAKDEANVNASNINKETTLKEKASSTEFNNSIDVLQTQQEAQTLNWNLQAMSNSQATGNELSQMAASGTRSSSMQTAVDLESAVNAQQLQYSQNSQRASDSYSLNSLLNNMAQTVSGIQQNRTSADRLVKSYAEGGSQYNLYTKQRANQEAAYNDKINEINNAIDDIEDSAFGNFFTRFFSAGASGLNAYSSISNAVTDFASGINYNSSLGKTSSIDITKLSWSSLSNSGSAASSMWSGALS